MTFPKLHHFLGSLLFSTFLVSFLWVEKNGVYAAGSGDETRCSLNPIRLRAPRGVISTPNFPHQFPTPYHCTWIIDTTAISETNATIFLYLTQLYTIDSVRLKQYTNYNFNIINHLYERDSKALNLRNTRYIATMGPYLEIRIDLNSQYMNHIRVANHFLDYYGFNITYEIKPGNQTALDPKSCSFAFCSYAGNCYMNADYQGYFCKCIPEHYGENCEYGPSCDPRNNKTFCYNGGSCKKIGTKSGQCICTEGFTGPYCETKIKDADQETSVCPRNYQDRDCEEKCMKNIEFQNRPCRTLCEKELDPKNEIETKDANLRYEGKFRVNRPLSLWDSQIANTRRHATELLYLDTLQRKLMEKVKDFCGGNNLSIYKVGLNSEVVFQMLGTPSCITGEIGPVLKSLKSEFAIILNDTAEFKLESRPPIEIKLVKINKRLPLQLGKDFSITCIAIGSANIKFQWFKDSYPVNSTLANRYIINDSIPRDELEQSSSILIFDKASYQDKGIFTCQVSDMGQRICKNADVYVLLPPIIKIEPTSKTVFRNQSVYITCTSSNENMNFNFAYNWKKDGMLLHTVNSPNEVIEDLYPFGSLLRILWVEKSSVYTCEASNSAGVVALDVHVNLIESENSDTCRSEGDQYKISWNLTAPGQTQIQTCPNEMLGFAKRSCLSYSKDSDSGAGHLDDNNGQFYSSKKSKYGQNKDDYGRKPYWDKPNFSNCVSQELSALNSSLQSMKMGFSVYSGVELLMRDLVIYLKSREFLYSGEADEIISVLKDSEKFAEDKGRIKESFPELLHAFSTLFKFNGSFIREDKLVLLRESLISLVKNYKNFFNSFNTTRYETDNLLIEMYKIEKSPSSKGISDKALIQKKIEEESSLYIFPKTDDTKSISGSWLSKFRVSIPLNSKISSKVEQTTSTTGVAKYTSISQSHKGQKADDEDDNDMLIFIIFRNFSALLSQSFSSRVQNLLTISQKLSSNVEILSPLIYFNFPHGYAFGIGKFFTIEFVIPSYALGLIQSGKRQLTCGAMLTEKWTFSSHLNTITWKNNACQLISIENNTATCQCEEFEAKHFALLMRPVVETDIKITSRPLHWIAILGNVICAICCLLSMSIISHHLKCQFSTSNLYVLKMYVCISLFFSILLFVHLKAETSSVGVTVAFCSILLTSICSHLTKVLNILLLTRTSLFPWLRSVSLLTLYAAVCLATVLPIWTAGAALSHSLIASTGSNNSKIKSVFTEGSSLFGTFIGTLAVIFLVFLTIFYKTTRRLREMGIKNKMDRQFTNMNEYRKRTLNRSLILTLGTYLYILSMILYINIQDSGTSSDHYDYFMGFSTMILGILLLICYTIKAEFPIPLQITKHLSPNNNPGSDVEKLTIEQKLQYNGSSNSTRTPNSSYKSKENGQVSTVLLQNSKLLRQKSSNSVEEIEIPLETPMEAYMGATASTNLGFSRHNSVTRSISSSSTNTNNFAAGISGNNGGKRPSVGSNKIQNNDSSSAIQRSGTFTNSNSNGIGSSNNSTNLFEKSCMAQQRAGSGGGGANGLTQNHQQCSLCCKKNRSHRSQTSIASSMGGRIRPERGRCLIRDPDYVLPSNSLSSSNSSTDRQQPSTSAGSGGGVLSLNLQQQSSINNYIFGNYIDPSPQYETREFLTFRRDSESHNQNPTTSSHFLKQQQQQQSQNPQVSGRILENSSDYMDNERIIPGAECTAIAIDLASLPPPHFEEETLTNNTNNSINKGLSKSELQLASSTTINCTNNSNSLIPNGIGGSGNGSGSNTNSLNKKERALITQNNYSSRDLNNGQNNDGGFPTDSSSISKNISKDLDILLDRNYIRVGKENI